MASLRPELFSLAEARLWRANEKVVGNDNVRIVKIRAVYEIIDGDVK